MYLGLITKSHKKGGKIIRLEILLTFSRLMLFDYLMYLISTI